MGIHEQIPIQARVKATLAPSPQRLHRSCQSTIVDSHQYPATNLKLKKSIIPLRIQPIPPWSESESHCDKQTSSETKIQPQTSSSHPPPTSRPRRRTMPSGRVLWAMIGVRMGGRAWSLVRLQGREG